MGNQESYEQRPYERPLPPVPIERQYTTISTYASRYPRWGWMFWLPFITVLFSISLFVVSGLAIMAATSSVTVWWPIAITSGVYIAVYMIVGGIALFFYSTGMGRNMTLMHNTLIYGAYIVTFVVGFIIFAIDINWLDRFSTCCDSDVIDITVPIEPQFLLYFVARLWDCFGYFIIGVANVAACWASYYPYKVVGGSTALTRLS
jgi:hypothetical protein